MVAGYCLANDVSERVFQIERAGQWIKGKSSETFGPLGPWLVTKDEIKNPQGLAMWLDVNGEKRQRGNTKTMIFDCRHLVWYCSQFFVLEPGVMDYIEEEEEMFEHRPLSRLAEDGQLMAYRHTSFWQCMDTMREKQLLNDYWNSGKAPWKIWKDHAHEDPVDWAPRLHRNGSDTALAGAGT